MPDHNTQPKDHTPDSFDRDLHPESGAGINDRALNPENEALDAPNAEQITQLRNLVPDLTNDELSRIVVLPEGARLREGATYIDLMTPDRQEFTARAGMAVGSDNVIVGKHETDYQIWNRLRGINDPQRTGEDNR